MGLYYFMPPWSVYRQIVMFIQVIKGIVHPKIKILSSFTHPQVVPNLYECLCSAEHKGRYSEECGKQSSSGALELRAPEFSPPYYGSQWCPKTAWLQTFFKISSFVFGRTKTFIQVWNYLGVSKWWQKFHFWVNYPFNVSYMCLIVLYANIYISLILKISQMLGNEMKFAVREPIGLR